MHVYRILETSKWPYENLVIYTSSLVLLRVCLHLNMVMCMCVILKLDSLSQRGPTEKLNMGGQ